MNYTHERIEGKYLDSVTYTDIFKFENGQTITFFFDTGQDEDYTSNSFNGDEIIEQRLIRYGYGSDVCWDDLGSIIKKAIEIQQRDSLKL